MRPRRLSHLLRERTGASAVEFALLAPVLIGMMLGVIQFGIGMQRYNALRSVAGEVARYAMVQCQARTSCTDADTAAAAAQTYGTTLATSGKYDLPSTGTTLTVTSVATSRISGTYELNISVTTPIASFLSIFDLSGFDISYSRPAFVVVNT